MRELNSRNGGVVIFKWDNLNKKTPIVIFILATLKKLWNVNLSFWLWFNLITLPLIMLWPDLSNE